MKIRKAVIFLAVLIITSVLLGMPVNADTTVAPQNEPTIAVDENPSKNETVYAMLHSDGSVQSIYVVNQLIGEYIDYGTYDTIKNVSTTSVPVIEGDKITFPDEAVQGGLFYQGTMDAPLPMVFNIAYTLDGKTVLAEHLAGAEGHLKIEIDYRENTLCDEAVRDGYMAQITLAMRTDKAKNISAPNVTQVLAGSTVQLGHTVFSGDSGTTVIEADVNDFEMDAISITLIKGMPSLGDFEESIDDLEEGFDDMLGGADELVEGTTELKDGMVSLKDGAGDLSYGLGKLDDAGDAFASGMDHMSDAIEAYTGGINDAAGGAAQIQTALDELAAGGQSVADGVAQADAGLAGLCASGADLTALAQALLANPDPSVQALAQGVIDTMSAANALSAGLSQASQGVADYTAGVAQTATGFAAISDGLSVSGAAGDQLYGGFDDLNDGFEELSGGIGSSARGAYKLYKGIEELPANVQELIDGQIEFADGIADAKAEITTQTQEFTDEESPVVSFASPRKNKPESVQYIMMTPAIRIAKDIDEQSDQETEENFFTRFADLFKG